MPDDTLQILKTSTDSRQLQAAALTRARSPSPADHDQLLQLLSSADFLNRLDSPADYRSGNRLRVSRVLQALVENPAPTGPRTFISLMQNNLFLSEIPRVIELVRFSVNFRPPQKEVLAFWDKFSQPDDSFTSRIMNVLVDNGTEPALRLFEKKMADPANTDGSKIALMRSRILPHRNELPLLLSCERLLHAGLPANLRPDLVESLFDYKPAQWYLPATPVNRPNRLLATAAARAQLRKIGEWSLQNLPLDESQKLAVKITLKEIADGDKSP